MSLLRWFRRQRALTKSAIVLVGVLGTVSLSLFLVVSYVASSFTKGMCGSHGSHEFASPDGRYKAVLFEYDCGATTDYGTQVALLPASKPFSAEKITDDQRIFSADSDHQAVNVDREGILPIEIRWIGTHKLRIEFPAKARIYQSSYKNRITEIEYVSR